MSTENKPTQQPSSTPQAEKPSQAPSPKPYRVPPAPASVLREILGYDIWKRG